MIERRYILTSQAVKWYPGVGSIHFYPFNLILIPCKMWINQFQFNAINLKNINSIPLQFISFSVPIQVQFLMIDIPFEWLNWNVTQLSFQTPQYTSNCNKLHFAYLFACKLYLILNFIIKFICCNIMTVHNLTIICWMLYACLLMKCSVSFYPNNAIFTQNIHESMGWLFSYIWPKSVQNLLKYQCTVNVLGCNEILYDILEMGQDFFRSFHLLRVSRAPEPQLLWKIAFYLQVTGGGPRSTVLL